MWGGLTGACGGQRDPLTGVYDGGWWPDRYAYVKWANGIEAFYRAGHDGCYDLSATCDPQADRCEEKFEVVGKVFAVLNQ